MSNVHQVEGSPYQGMDPNSPDHDDFDRFVMATENILGQTLDTEPVSGVSWMDVAYQAFLAGYTPQQLVDKRDSHGVQDLRTLTI